MIYLLKYVVLAGYWLLRQIFYKDVTLPVLSDLEAALGTGLAGVGQEIHYRLVVDLDEGSLQGTWT